MTTAFPIEALSWWQGCCEIGGKFQTLPQYMEMRWHKTILNPNDLYLCTLFAPSVFFVYALCLHSSMSLRKRIQVHKMSALKTLLDCTKIGHTPAINS